MFMSTPARQEQQYYLSTPYRKGCRLDSERFVTVFRQKQKRRKHNWNDGTSEKVTSGTRSELLTVIREDAANVDDATSLL